MLNRGDKRKRAAVAAPLKRFEARCSIQLSYGRVLWNRQLSRNPPAVRTGGGVEQPAAALRVHGRGLSLLQQSLDGVCGHRATVGGLAEQVLRLGDGAEPGHLAGEAGHGG